MNRQELIQELKKIIKEKSKKLEIMQGFGRYDSAYYKLQDSLESSVRRVSFLKKGL